MKNIGRSILVGVLVGIIILAGCTPSAAPPPTAVSTPGTSATGTAKPSASPAPAALPNLVTITTLAVGTSKYVQSAGFREAVEKLTPMKVRLESTDTDLGRVAPLQMGESEFAYLTAVNAQMAARGEADYKNIGPTALRRVWNGNPFLGAMFARGNAGFKKVSDLRGKSIPQTKASVAWSQNNEAILAFGGLTLADVKVVNVASIAAGMAGPLEGGHDASQGTLWNPSAIQLASSPHGVFWFDMPASDTVGWQGVQRVTPWARPIGSSAAGLKPGETITGAGYEQGIWTTDKVPSAVIYAFAKAMKDGFNIYKDMEPELKDWTWQRATSVEGLLDLPYADGTVQFMKDQGVWTPAHEKFQQDALKSEAARMKK